MMGSRRRVGAAAAAVIEQVESRLLLAISGISPVNGGQNVPVSANITVTFAGAMTASTINSSTFQLRNAAGTLIPATVTYSSSTRTATLDPISNLPSGNNFYYARVVGGPGGVRTASGGTLPNDFHWAFTTGVPQFSEVTVLSGLSHPTAVEFAPDGRIFVAEKRGIIKVFDDFSDPSPDIFADLRTETHNHWDRGLLGLALDPQFTTGRPYVYALYTYDAPIGGTAPAWGTVNGDSDPGPGTSGNGPAVSGRLVRLTASGNVAVARTVLVEDWGQQYPSHSIGHVQFGPDGYLYASAGDGASFGAVDYGQNNLLGDPPNEGGALRSQHVRSNNTTSYTTLDGTIIRIHPDTGAPAPGNPFTGNANRQRIIAYGLRNPFRFNFRPGTQEIWVAEVGWGTWEEINRITHVGDSFAENFGWPAYEGPNRQNGYDNANLPLLESLYSAGAAAHQAPYYAWSHSAQVVPGSGEPTGGSSATGVAFYTSGSYPLSYDGAMFFADYSRKRIFVMYRGLNGLPDVNNRQVFRATSNGPVELQIGPGGDLFYVDMTGGRIGRFTFANAASNNPPTASFTASPTTGSVPLTVNFNGSASSDPDAGDVLTFAWDLDGDGNFNDSTAVAPTFTYTTAGPRQVRLRVTDRGGLSHVASQTITVGSLPPTPVIATPAASLNWKVGDTISFSGSANDPEEGTLDASRLRWELVLMHDSEINPGNPHEHIIQSFSGVASGQFIAPDHEYPSWIELRLTATDSSNLSTTVVRRIDPQTVSLNFTSSPAGLRLSVGGQNFVTPFSRTVIVGSANTLSAPAQGNANGYYTFASWSNGGAATHEIIAPPATTTYTATFTNEATGSGLRGQYFDNADFTGTTVTRTDPTINFNWGTAAPISGFGADTFSVRWTGQILAPVTGLYQFFTNTDDGARLWVNNELLVDKLVNQSLTEWSGNIGLMAGVKYDIRLDYFENTGSARAELRWTIPGFSKQIIPQQFLFVSTPPLTPPAAPSNLVGTVVTSNRVDLSWNDNSDNETGFVIERRYAAWIWEPLATVGPDVTGYSDTTAIANVTYDYRVRAVNPAGESAWSNEPRVDTSQVPSAGVPAAASGLSAVALSTTLIRLSWTDNSNNESGFRIQRRSNGTTSWATLATTAANTTTYDDSAVSANQTYEYRVIATNAAGDAPASNIASATTQPSGIPNAPTNLVASVLPNGKVRLNWADNSDNETGFRIERRFAAWIWEVIATVGANTTQYDDLSAIGNVTYEYRVAAVSTAGSSPYSNGALVNTPLPPSGLRASATPSVLTLSWTDQASNETGYAVQRQQEGSSQWVTAAVLPPDSTRFSENLRGKKHKYRVFALGTLRDSASISVTVPGKQTLLTAWQSTANKPPKPNQTIWSRLAL